MSSLHFELTTPECIVLKEEADSVTLPTAAGEITVLPNHMPLVAVLASGVMTVRRGTEESYVAVTGGFLEVRTGSTMIVLADVADRAEELDRAAVEAARDRAKKLLTEERHADEVSGAAALAGLEREIARIRALEKHRSRRLPKGLPSVE